MRGAKLGVVSVTPRAEVLQGPLMQASAPNIYFEQVEVKVKVRVQDVSEFQRENSASRGRHEGQDLAQGHNPALGMTGA